MKYLQVVDAQAPTCVVSSWKKLSVDVAFFNAASHVYENGQNETNRNFAQGPKSVLQFHTLMR